MAEQAYQPLTQDPLHAIDQTTLTPLVQYAVGSTTMEVIDWQHQRLYGGMNDVGTSTTGVFRFAGRGQDQGATTPWSLILKIIDPAAQADPQRGRREWLAYQSGLLNHLAGNLRSPRCFAASEQADGKLWLWLAEVHEEVGPRWPLERYALAARHLGQFNGAYLLDKPLPNEAWLRSKDWLRNALTHNAPAMAQLRTAAEHPRFSRMYPGAVLAGLFQLWAEREHLLDALGRLPLTLCHHDGHRRNLFAQRGDNGQEQTVVIDWDLVGLGAVGQDLVPLVQISLLAFDVEHSQAQQLDEIVFDSYLTGLQDAGWRGDSQAARFGYAASSALYLGLGLPIMTLDLLLASDERKNAVMERVFGRPIEEILTQWAYHFQFLLNLADQARDILPKLGD
jgi:hypothetical protein